MQERKNKETKRLTGTCCWDERGEDQTEAGDDEQPSCRAVHIATNTLAPTFSI